MPYSTGSALRKMHHWIGWYINPQTFRIVTMRCSEQIERRRNAVAAMMACG
jgi:hypothetical protein